MRQLSLVSRLLEHLTPEEARVWEVLQEHRGAEQAITNHELAAQTCLAERLVRWAVKSLVEEHRKPIGSLPGLGVFLLTTTQERTRVLDFYRGHALSLLKRMSVLSNYNTRYLIRQLEMELDDLLEQAHDRH